MKKQLLSRTRLSQLFFSLALFLLCANASWGQNPPSATDSQQQGDFRSRATGDWNTAATWQSYDSTLGWQTATAAPTATNTVYIQVGHIITFSAESYCYSLHICQNSGAQGQLRAPSSSSAFYLNVSGKIRGYAGAVDVTTGLTTFNTGIDSYAVGGVIMTSAMIANTPKIRFVGVSRTITFANEWKAQGPVPNGDFAFDAGAVVTSETALKFNPFVFTSGTIIVNDQMSANPGLFQIKNGAKVITSGGQTTSYTIGNASATATGTVTIDLGGTLELTGVNPIINTLVFNNNGTVIYSGGSLQTMINRSNAAGIDQTALNANYTNLVIASGTTINPPVTVAVSGNLTLENNANLLQSDNLTVSGTTTVKRNSSALLRSDYTLWSSPVANQNLLAFSPATTSTRFYNYDTTFGTNGAYSVVADPATTPFAVGTGYLIRMPNTDPTSNYDAGTATLNYPGVFTGTLNNGPLSVALVDGLASGLRYNLVGNPYPSPITMTTFVADNTANIESTLYFWRKTNGVGTAYCSWAGGVFTTNSNAQSVDPAGIIQTGQGFFVEAKSGATSLAFNNAQRVVNNANQFFKTRQVADNSRIWLNATNAAGAFSQMAVNYTAEATNGLDAYDGKYINDSAFALTSNVNNGEYTIQGRPSFDATDVVALNFKAITAGEYTIAIDHADGVFANGQDVYLVDNTTGTVTDLNAGSYTFTAASGADNTRFSLTYQKTLSVNSAAFNDNSITVYKNNGTLYVKSGASAISSIKVFDIQGRLIAEQKSVNANVASINNLKATNQALIVQVTSDDNKVVSKKVVN